MSINHTRFIRAALVAGLAVTAAVLPVTASAGDPAGHRPTTYVVAETPGVLPEGIEVTRDGTLYVTSVGTGAVYRGSVRNPRLEPFLPAGGDGRTEATGIHVDRWGRILVAGYGTGKLFHYDRDGRLLAVRTSGAGSALNDFSFTRDAVYVTDSVNDVIWRAPLGPAGLGELRPWLDLDAQNGEQDYFLNGIVTTGDERTLLVSAQGTDQTYRVGIATREASLVAVSGANGLLSADGMLLEGHRLYAVYNYSDGQGGWLYVTRLVRMSEDWSHATVIADSEIRPRSETPTTVARDRDRLLWVNSQLGGRPGVPPYTVTEVPGLR